MKVIGGGAEFDVGKTGKKLLRIKIAAEVGGTRREYAITFGRYGSNAAGRRHAPSPPRTTHAPTPVSENKQTFNTAQRYLTYKIPESNTKNIKNDTRHAMDQTDLHKAALTGNAEKVKELLKKGADPNTQDKYGNTPLHMAASGGYVDVVRLLLKRGVDPNARDKDSRTPLHEAAYWGRLDVVKLFLVYGADPTVKDKDGRTPLDLARAEGRRGLFLLLRSG